MMKKNISVTVAILVLALIMSLATAAAAIADSSSQGGFSGSGQFQDRMQDEFIQALAAASGETVAQIQAEVTNGQTVAQIAQQLAQAGTITETSLATAIQQVLAAEDQTMATNLAQALISGQVAGGQGNSGQTGNSQSGQWQNGGQGTGQGSDMLEQALATASNQTLAQIQAEVNNGQTPAQIAQQLASAGTITETSLAAAIQQAMPSSEQTRAATDAQDLISGQMPGRQGGAQGGTTSANNTTTGNGIVLTIGSSQMYVNGAAQDIDPGYQTSPVILHSRTFVPIRAIIEKLGGTVTWDAASQQLTITLNKNTIVLTVGSATATVNGAATALDDAPYISTTGRTMLPLAFITNNLGHKATWNSAARSITIQ